MKARSCADGFADLRVGQTDLRGPRTRGRPHALAVLVQGEPFVRPVLGGVGVERMTAPGRAVGLAAAEFFGDVDLGVHLVAHEEASRGVRQADAAVDGAVHDGRFGAHVPRDRPAANRGNAFGLDVGPSDAEPFEQVIDAIQRAARTSAGNDQVSVSGPKDPLLLVKLPAIDARLSGHRGRADVDGDLGRLGLGSEHARHAGHFAQIRVEFLGGGLLGNGRRVGEDDGHGVVLFQDEGVLPGGDGSQQGEGQHGTNESIHSEGPFGRYWGGRVF